MIATTNTRVNITLPRDLVSDLDRAASYWGQTRSDYIADLIRNDVDRGATAQARDLDIKEGAARLYGKMIFIEGRREA